jgi:hypothetical protein
MNFKVKIPEAIQKLVSSWQLRPQIHRQFLVQLRDELGSRPFEVGLIHSVAPIRILHYPFDIPDGSQTHRFVVAFEPNETVRTVTLINAWHSALEQPATTRPPLVARQTHSRSPLPAQSQDEGAL